MEKLISIIVPCYNVENLIDRCFNSIINQTVGVEKLEIILVDDASEDGTLEKLLEFEQRFPEAVMVVQCDENGRQGTARNIGLSYSSGKYITFVDADDWIETDMLERLLRPMSERDYDFTMCMHVRDDGSGRGAKISRNQECRQLLIDTPNKRKIFLLCMSIGSTCWGKLYRRSFLYENDIRFADGLSYEDHLFMLLLYLYSRQVCILDYVGYHYFVNPNSTVLRTNGSHHEDVLVVDEISWDECIRRGFLDIYFEELEYYFMQIAFLGPLRSLVIRFEASPYIFYCKLRNNLINRTPNFMNNQYINDFMTDMNKELLKIASVPISEAEFSTLFDMLKRK